MANLQLGVLRPAAASSSALPVLSRPFLASAHLPPTQIAGDPDLGRCLHPADSSGTYPTDVAQRTGKVQSNECATLENYCKLSDAKESNDSNESRYISDARVSATSSQPFFSGSCTTAEFGRSNSDHLDSSTGNTPASFREATVPTGECLKQYVRQNYDKLNHHDPVDFGQNTSTTTITTFPQSSQVSNQSSHIPNPLVLASQESPLANAQAQTPVPRQHINTGHDSTTGLSPALSTGPITRTAGFVAAASSKDSNYNCAGVYRHVTSRYSGSKLCLRASASPLAIAAYNQRLGFDKSSLLVGERVKPVNVTQSKQKDLAISAGSQKVESLKVDSSRAGLKSCSRSSIGQEDVVVVAPDEWMASRKSQTGTVNKSWPEKKQRGVCHCC